MTELDRVVPCYGGYCRFRFLLSNREPQLSQAADLPDVRLVLTGSAIERLLAGSAGDG